MTNDPTHFWVFIIASVRNPECFPSPRPLLRLVCFPCWAERFPDSPPLGEQGAPETDLLSSPTPAVLHKGLINSLLFTS